MGAAGVNALAQLLGNLAQQATTNKCFNLSQALAQAGLGALSGGLGNLAGLTQALNALKNSSALNNIDNALIEGGLAEAAAAGAASVWGNLGLPSTLGGF